MGVPTPRAWHGQPHCVLTSHGTQASPHPEHGMVMVSLTNTSSPATTHRRPHTQSTAWSWSASLCPHQPWHPDVPTPRAQRGHGQPHQHVPHQGEQTEDTGDAFNATEQGGCWHHRHAPITVELLTLNLFTIFTAVRGSRRQIFLNHRSQLHTPKTRVRSRIA